MIWYERVLPTVPLAAAGLVITGATELIARVRPALPEPPGLVALTITFDVPAAVGVPEISPVVPLTASPGGKPVAA